MTAKDLLLELIKRQKKNSYRSGNWDKLEVHLEVGKDGITIALDSVDIGFSFDKKGRFEGIFNFKQ